MLTFAAAEGYVTGANGIYSDGDDVIFGDLGNDWRVGGTGRDAMYGGFGNDLLDADDNKDTAGGSNLTPDGPEASYEDIAYGGAGRDVLIANTGGDRLIDWAGEFNSYIVPFAPFGMGTVSRTLQPQLAEFLYDLSASDGADFTRGGDTARNGEPDGELGVVRQQDFAWRDQTGAPDDPQPGNIPGGARDVLRSASFDGPQGIAGTGFFADSGVFEASGGELSVAAESLGGDAVAVYHVGDQLPIYFELQASVKMDKANGGWDANAYMIFDYQNEYDFKFVGIDDSINKLVMGHRDATGWHVDEQGVVKGGVKPDRWYNMLVAVNGLNVTLVVDNNEVFQHTYDPRIVDGYSYGLNWGMIGMGSNNAQGSFDNIRVQILPPQVTFEDAEDFDDDQADLFTGESSGTWTVDAGRYDVTPSGNLGISMLDLGPDNLNFNSYLELSADVNTADQAGFIFDRYGDESFKYASIYVANQQLVIGHYTQKSGWVVDEAVSTTIDSSKDYTVGLTLKGTSGSVTLNDASNGGYQAILGYVFNAATVDGNFGLFTKDGVGSFDNVDVKTDDPVFVNALMAVTGATENRNAVVLSPEELAPIVDSAIEYWRSAGHDVSALEGITFEVSDLPGTLLGLVEDDTVYIDADAAGHGWFVDPTPLKSEEFNVADDGSLTAIAGSDAEGRIDLLTAVTHELGHLLGISHDDTVLMDASLDVGTRELSTSSDSTIEASELDISEQNILVTMASEWAEPVFADSPDMALPNIVHTEATSDEGLGVDEPMVALVFDDDSGDFIDVDRRTEIQASETAPMDDGETSPTEERDWVFYATSDTGRANIDYTNKSPSANDKSVLINWDAEKADREDLLPPPLPGRSGLERTTTQWM